MTYMVTTYIRTFQRKFIIRTDMVRRCAMFVLALFFCTQLHAVIHHHDDLGDHPDCSICAVSHYQSTDTALPLLNIAPEPFIGQVPLYSHAVWFTSPAFHTHSGRAPPQTI